VPRSTHHLHQRDYTDERHHTDQRHYIHRRADGHQHHQHRPDGADDAHRPLSPGRPDQDPFERGWRS
jgi:hypothetical protein